ncbi:MAG TPA: membrane protein insertase YidC [Pseudolysinimonas sp.]
MNGIGTVLTPIKWVIEAILVGFHWVFTNVFGLDSGAGITWVLSIVGLTVIVRAALIPVFVRQIKSQRKMMEVAPQLKKIQDKYKGKKDQFSREAMQRETMEMYRKAGTNPLASCLPLLIQMPIFFSLLPTLNEAKPDASGHFHAGVGLFSKDLVESLYKANLFGVAPLKDSIQTAWGHEWVVVIIAATIVVLMTASQFFTQLQLTSKNMSPETKASPMYRQQRMLLYVLPVIFIFSGFAFPIGAMFYWLTSNVWTLVQQFLVIRNMPTPGSEAALAREARLARKNRQRMSEDAAALEQQPDAGAIEAPKRPATTQRSQPVSKNRAKKTGSGKK